MTRHALILAVTLLTVPLLAPATARARHNPLRVPAPPRIPTVHQDHCPGLFRVLGCTFQDGDIYLRPGLRRGVRRFVRWHELGHQYDFQVLTDPERVQLTVMMGGEASDGWLTPDMFGVTPDEDFANYYARCQVRDDTPDGMLFSDEVPLRTICASIRAYMPRKGQWRGTR